MIMIIVSQDKNSLVNLKNITQIFITECEEEENSYFIRYENLDGAYEDLGVYVTEEREEDKKKIAELEAKLEFYQWGDLDNLKFEEYMKEFIPKQKVKDLKESIVLEPTIVGGRRNAKTLEYGIKLGKIKACEELLEDK